MREIKFRGLTAVLREMVHGNLIRDVHGDFYIVGPAAMSFSENDMVFRPSPSAKVDPETIGQYTGLKDKNGVEIYEGDIVASESGHSKEILFSSYYASFVGRPLPLSRYDDFFPADPKYSSHSLTQEWFDESGFVVIGNIHQHPELLNQD